MSKVADMSWMRFQASNLNQVRVRVRVGVSVAVRVRFVVSVNTRVG